MPTEKKKPEKKKKKNGVCILTSSISWRETFLVSLLEVDTEPESVTGASVVWLFGWSPWDS